jgi:hypothetical protein
VEVLLALVAGVAIGWVLGRAGVRSRVVAGELDEKPRRMTKRQREILAALPPDPEIPTLLDLIHEEAESAGITEIPGAEGVPVPVRLQVFRRDETTVGPCAEGAWRFVLAPDVAAEAAGPEDLHLVCDGPDDTPPAEPSPA